MATTTSEPKAGEDDSRTATPPFPPLQNGDRLSRAEFEKRYTDMRHLKKAELLEGVVYIPTALSFGREEGEVAVAPPVSFPLHANPRFNLIGWLGSYCAATPNVEGGCNASLRLDLDNVPQPDAVLTVSPECEGQVRIDRDGFIEGAPELIAEVAASSVSYDLHVKLHVYRRNGVREYVVWRVYDQTIDWFVLRDGQYERLVPSAAGLFQSEVFPGLWLDSVALLRGDLAALAHGVQLGVATPEHAAFVDQLKKAVSTRVGSK
jgi:Uma2 family endonuclease